jgi:hypothetical protein
LIAYLEGKYFSIVLKWFSKTDGKNWENLLQEERNETRMP